MNSLAPIDDINLKIFDEICEERFAGLDLECILVSIIDNVMHCHTWQNNTT